MELKDILPITISVIALFVTFLTVFLSLRSQLKLHVMTVILCLTPFFGQLFE